MDDLAPHHQAVDVAVVPVTSFRGAVDAMSPFGADDEPAIARHWRAALAEKPEMFDGRVLLGVQARIEDGALCARYADVSFSAFHWWRAAGPDRGLRNVFGAAAVVTADGAVLLGRMAPHTAPSGQLYFPCGTPDLEDIFDGRVDLDRSIERELLEETGLSTSELEAGERLAVFAPKVVAYVRRFETALTAAQLKERVEAFLGSEEKPELDAVVLVRSAAELTEASPPYVHLALPRLMKDDRPG
jgi:8-oxo-dGTP pyrophosphatase MutT (NUDIX family)